MNHTSNKDRHNNHKPSRSKRNRNRPPKHIRDRVKAERAAQDNVSREPAPAPTQEAGQASATELEEQGLKPTVNYRGLVVDMKTASIQELKQELADRLGFEGYNIGITPIKPRHYEMLGWICKADQVTEERLLQTLIASAILKVQPQYREHHGAIASTTKDIAVWDKNQG